MYTFLNLSLECWCIFTDLTHNFEQLKDNLPFSNLQHNAFSDTSVLLLIISCEVYCDIQEFNVTLLNDNYKNSELRLEVH